MQEATTGCEQYRPLFEKYEWDVKIAMAIMGAETRGRCNADAVGDNYPINGLLAVSCGLMQVRTLVGRPDCETLKNPATNIEWAHKIYQASVARGSSGWYPWSTYNDGKYLQYIGG